MHEIVVMRCAIWYHLYNLKTVKNTHGGMLLLVKVILVQVITLHGCFSRFLNCTNDTKSRKTSQLARKCLTRTSRTIFTSN